MDLRIEISPMIPLSANTDKHRLQQVLINLLGNALKFTRAGEIILKVTNLNDGLLSFHVIDTGSGIAEVDKHRIFKMFCTIDERLKGQREWTKGVGFGLTVS